MAEKYQKLLEKIKKIKGFDTLDEAEDWYFEQMSDRHNKNLEGTNVDGLLNVLLKPSSKKAIKAKRKV